MNSEISHIRNNGNEGSFVMSNDGTLMAQLLYRESSDTVTIDHVEVSPERRGSGMGAKLVASAVEYARGVKKKVFPMCSYARAVMERHKEYQDVLSR